MWARADPQAWHDHRLWAGVHPGPGLSAGQCVSEPEVRAQTRPLPALAMRTQHRVHGEQTGQCWPMFLCIMWAWSALQGNPVCRCLPGFIPMPDTISGCRRECEVDRDCGAGNICDNYRWHPTWHNDTCPRDTWHSRCAPKPDPCDPSPCGPNTECSPNRQGNPVCTCLPGFEPQPDTITGCSRIEARTPPPDPCFPSPCGPNTQCSVNRWELKLIWVTTWGRKCISHGNSWTESIIHGQTFLFLYIPLNQLWDYFFLSASSLDTKVKRRCRLMLCTFVPLYFIIGNCLL